MLDNPNWKPAEIETEVWQDILFKAAELVDSGHWCQCEIVKTSIDGSKFCAVGALYYAGTGKLPSKSTHECRAEISVDPAMRKSLSAIEAFVARDAVSWNDQPGRTKEQVADAFLKAASIAFT